MSDLGSKEAMAANIKRLLHQFGKTRQQLSEGTGINYQTISSWMSQKSYLRIDNIERMANFFHVPKSELVESQKSREALKRSEKYPYAFINIPVIGSIACGEPILAEQSIDGYTDQAFMRQTSDGLFALRCKGKSMEPTIPDGSIVVIHQQPIVEDGEIAAVQMHSEGADTDEATLKRVKHVGGHVLLMPDNQAYDPIVVDKDSGARIIGKAVRIEIDL